MGPYTSPIVNEVVAVPRLFVALDLPQAIKQSLEPLAKGLGDVRWLAPEQQHLTLRFIGEVDNGAVHEIAEALATVPARPFELTLKGLGHFPPRGEPRVLWVGVDKNPELREPETADRPGAQGGGDAAGARASSRRTSPSRASARRCRRPASAPI